MFYERLVFNFNLKAIGSWLGFSYRASLSFSNINLIFPPAIVAFQSLQLNLLIHRNQVVLRKRNHLLLFWREDHLLKKSGIKIKGKLSSTPCLRSCMVWPLPLQPQPAARDG